MTSARTGREHVLAMEPLEAAVHVLAARLLEKRASASHWEGFLAASALSTATAVLALHIVAQRRHGSTSDLESIVSAGARWLVANQNADAGWGDTVRSRSNISTTAIVWATLSAIPGADPMAAAAIERSGAWLQRAAGAATPDALRTAILSRYGNDRTFSVPILVVLALAGRLGTDEVAWRSIPQLPFELAAVPHAWFRHLRLPVVSYALPALIAIGQLRHHLAPSGNPIARIVRERVSGSTLRLLREIQPESGGYLEATPLTSFVVMSLGRMGLTSSPVVDAGVRFLLESMREDGSWPIDTNLATWVTTLSTGALGAAGALSGQDRDAMREWLFDQQSAAEHPFTHADPGAWAWTPLSGGVPDADDTSGALLALRQLGEPDLRAVAAATGGVRWLLGVQNRDGGIPTFCRGWGALPFDRSTPEITAHALQAWRTWHSYLETPLQRVLRTAANRAEKFLVASQEADGSWIPLWFGNEHAPGENNPTYGTARVLTGLAPASDPRTAGCSRRAVRWLLDTQNSDGGWGGARGVPSSIEETGVVLTALAGADRLEREVSPAVWRGASWLIEATHGGVHTPASPIGLYFARLWYSEDLYPTIFALSGLAACLSQARRASSTGGG